MKPIGKQFYLQINMLRLFYIIFWGKLKDYYLFQLFYNILAQKKVSIQVKEFYTYDNYFKTIIQAHTIPYCIYY